VNILVNELSEGVVHPRIALTRNIELQEGAHVLYTFTDPERYLDNAVSFISTGLKFAHGTIFVDDNSILDVIKKRLIIKGFSEEDISKILFLNSKDFYGAENVFDINKILNSSGWAFKKFLDQDIPIRSWAKVQWLADQCCLREKLKTYEFESDKAVNHIHSFSICAYDGSKLDASTQLEIMKSHQYIMTDNELTISNFYKNDNVASSLFLEEKNEEKIENLKHEFENISHFYKNLIEEMPDAVFITSNDSILYANKSATFLMEGTINELIGKNVFDFVHRNCVEQAKTRRSQKIKSLVEQKMVTLKGKHIDVEVASFPYLNEELNQPTLISIVRNISERKKWQEMQTQQLYFKGIVFNSLQMGLIAVEDKIVTMINEKSTEILAADYRLKNNIKTEKDMIKLIQASVKMNSETPQLEKILDNGEIKTNIEFKHKKGKTLEIDFIPITSDDKAISYVLVIKDIEHRKKIERDLNIAKSQAEKANQMKSMFLSQISHDLRTPLNTIQGYTQISLSELDGNSEKDSYRLNKIYGASKQLLKLIDEILDFSAIESGSINLSFEEIPLKAFIDDCVHSFMDKPNLSVNIFVKPIDSKIHLLTDPIRLRQILDNLISNAIKYNKKNGSILIEVEENGEDVTIKVSDTGLGIPQNELNQIFNPFYRSKKHMTFWKGTGLGLAIVSKLTEEMNGKVGVDSEEDKGSTFYVTLPNLKNTGENTWTMTYKPFYLNHGLKKNILYIEDNADNIELMKEMLLTIGGLNMVTEKSGYAGLKRAAEHKPDLILLDLNLPDVDGFQVIEELKRNEITQNIPVVIVSADVMEMSIKKARNKGCQYYLPKPVDIKELKNIILDLTKGTNK
jgi:PAS domain S-box-containing protein